jgi:hypothetical protein
LRYICYHCYVPELADHDGAGDDDDCGDDGCGGDDEDAVADYGGAIETVAVVAFRARSRPIHR